MSSPAIKEQIETKSVMYFGVKNDCMKPVLAIWYVRNHVMHREEKCETKKGRHTLQGSMGTQYMGQTVSAGVFTRFQTQLPHLEMSTWTCVKPHLPNSTGETGDHSSGETGGARTLSHLDMLQDILDSCPSNSLLCSTDQADFTNLLPSCSSPTPPHPISCLHPICCPQEPSPSQTLWHDAVLLLFKK